VDVFEECADRVGPPPDSVHVLGPELNIEQADAARCSSKNRIVQNPDFPRT